MLPLIMGGIGAGVGLLNNLMGGNKPQVSTSGIDSSSRDYIMAMRARAQQMAGQGMPALDPSFLAAMHGMQGYADAGAMGTQAMTDPTMAAKFMNPFMANMNPIFDQMRSESLNTLNKNATSAGAFGARRDLAQGNALRDVNNQQSQFSYQGFNDAMQRAMQLATNGMQANASMGEMGKYVSDRPMAYNQGIMQLLNQGYGGPISTTETKPTSQNPFQAALGGFMTGASFGGGGKPGATAPATSPWGAGGGGGWPTFGQSGAGTFDPFTGMRR